MYTVFKLCEPWVRPNSQPVLVSDKTWSEQTRPGARLMTIASDVNISAKHTAKNLHARPFPLVALSPVPSHLNVQHVVRAQQQGCMLAASSASLIRREKRKKRKIDTYKLY